MPDEGEGWQTGGLLINAIDQIKIFTLERDSVKETVAASNARSVNTKAGKKKDNKNTKNPKDGTNEPA